MSTPLTDKINALTALANETTGADDTTLTDALQSLISAYQNKYGCLELWKTVEIEENHTSASTANPIYWMNYFSIPEEDILSGIIYVLEIANDQEYATQHPSWHIYPYSIYFKNGLGEVDNFAHRTNTAIQGMSTGNYQYISAGAIVNIYKFMPDNCDIYPIGEDVVSRYIGRDWSTGSVPMIRGNANHETGLYEQDENGDYNISLNYIPVSPNYQYTKPGHGGFLYRVLFYDVEKNFLSGLRFTVNWNIWFSFTVPAEARYMRIATHSSDSYKNVYVLRSA